ncbi:MAG: hypothetical protein GMKNLPBB_00659 [Myxococcota bacterium]|nr:hypothetical protein [Myxococcota bacterium]
MKIAIISAAAFSLLACSGGTSGINDAGTPADGGAIAADAHSGTDLNVPGDADGGTGGETVRPDDGLSGYWLLYLEPATYAVHVEPWDGFSSGVAGMDILLRISQTGEKVRITAACDPDEVFAAGMIQGGTLTLFDPDMKKPISGALKVEPNTITGTQDTGRTLYALTWSRLKDVKCTDAAGAPVKHAPEQALQFADEWLNAPDESLTPGELARAGGGMKNLEAAARFTLPVAGDDMDLGAESQTCLTVDGKSLPCEEAAKNPDSLLVSSMEQDYVNTRVLENRPILGDWREIHPGALLQGGSFVKGVFKPISIARAGADFSLRYSSNGARSFSLPEVSPVELNKALANEFKTNPPTAHKTEWRTFQTWSAGHLAYEAGLDERFAGADPARLDLDTSSRKNTWVLQVTRHHYSVSMNTPRFRHSVFKEGDQFEDPANETGAGNPPLYVSRVNYGGNLFLAMKNNFDESTSRDALAALAAGKPGNTPIRGSTLKEIVDQSGWSWSARGFPARELETIFNSPPADRFAAVSAFVSRLMKPEPADWAAAEPIQFTLNYLQNRMPASMAFKTRFKAMNTTYYGGMPSVKNVKGFYMYIDYLDDDLHVYDITGGGERQIAVYGRNSPDLKKDLNISSWMVQGGDTVLRFRLGNGGCWATGIRVFWSVEGTYREARRREDVITEGSRRLAELDGYLGVSTCGWQYEVDLAFRWSGRTQPVSLVWWEDHVRNLGWLKFSLTPVLFH